MYEPEKLFKVFLTCHFIFLQVPLSSAQIQSRIAYGTLSSIEEAPFLVLLLADGNFLCSGTLVAPQYVVTAAHCVDKMKILIYTIAAGITHMNETGVRVKVNRIMLPKGYNNFRRGWDVAVLQLDSPVNGKHIKPIRLCKTTWSPGSTVEIYGWGKLNKADQIGSNQLRMAAVKTIGKYTCEYMYHNLIEITNTMFCTAVTTSKSACDGDSGGPAIIKGQFCGIISAGIGCDSYVYPNIFTNVRVVRDFIKYAIKILSVMRAAALSDI